METTTLAFMPNQHELKALTWKQPFAQLMLHGKIETRSRRTHVRGWVLICAGQSAYDYKKTLEIMGVEQYNRLKQTLSAIDAAEITTNHGFAIAIGKLVDCRPMTPEDADACFVAYRTGLWCHIYEDVQAIEPIPWKGAQGWRTVPDDVKSKIKILQQ